MSRERFDQLMSLDAKLWHKELQDHDALFEKLGPRLPRKLKDERSKQWIEFRLGNPTQISYSGKPQPACFAGGLFFSMRTKLRTGKSPGDIRIKRGTAVNQ